MKFGKQVLLGLAVSAMTLTAFAGEKQEAAVSADKAAPAITLASNQETASATTEATSGEATATATAEEPAKVDAPKKAAKHAKHKKAKKAKKAHKAKKATKKAEATDTQEQEQPQSQS